MVTIQNMRLVLLSVHDHGKTNEEHDCSKARFILVGKTCNFALKDSKDDPLIN